MHRPLLEIASTPAIAVSSDAVAGDAVAAMVEHGVGAVAVVDDGRLCGIFTERDLMTKVVGQGRDIAELKVSDVMLRDPMTVTTETPRDEAMDMMLSGHFRHLPVTDPAGVLVGMLSVRDLLRHQVNRLRQDVQSLEQYLAADGPGG